jgi:hypothetical protein
MNIQTTISRKLTRIPAFLRKRIYFDLFLKFKRFLLIIGDHSRPFAACFFIFLVSASTVHAGVVSLTGAEILKLRNLVASSPDAAQWAVSIENKAAKNLGETPNPISNIESAGKLKGSEEKTRTQEALKDVSRLKSIEWAYVLTGQKQYQQKAGDYLTAWAGTCQPPKNPIDGTNLETFIETYDLIRPQMNASDQQLVDNWLKAVIDTLFESDKAAKDTHGNNWQAHRLKIIGMAAFVLGDQDTQQRVLDALKALMDVNLNADGTTYDFLERDALHYHVYDLEPMIRLAMIYQRAQNLDLYHWKTDKGASIAQCVAFLVPYAKGEKIHPEWVHTKIQFDIQRGLNGEKGYISGENFDPKNSQKCLELAQFFEPNLKTLVGSLTDKLESPYPSFQVLINEVTRPTMGQPKP